LKGLKEKRPQKGPKGKIKTPKNKKKESPERKKDYL
jgi:hypothetical protein